MSLLGICLWAAVAVFILLSVLAVVMRLILWAFPAPEPGTDAAVVAAIAAAVERAYPGTVVTSIEEVR